MAGPVQTAQYLLGIVRVVFFLSVSFPLGAQEAVVLGNLDSHITLSPHAYYLVESESLTQRDAIAQFRRGEFQSIGSEWLELGLMGGVVWIAFTIDNTTVEDDFVLQVRNPRVSFIDVYQEAANGDLMAQTGGTGRPFSERAIRHPMPSFALTLPAGESSTLLIRMETIGDFRMRLWLWPGHAFYSHASNAYVTEMITLGVLLVLAIYQFLIFVSLRETSYLYLSFFIVMWMLFYSASTGLGNMLLWGDFLWLAFRANTVFFIMMCASFVLFAMSFLESKRYTPRLYRVALGFVALCLCHLVYALLTDTLLRMILNRYLAIGTIGFVVVLLIVAWYRGSPMAPLFFASWVFVFVGSGLLVLLSWYVLSSTWLMGTPLISLLFASSILLWSFELTGRVKVRVQKQREMLEKQVKERTRELEQALNDVKTLSGLLPICSSCKSIRDDTGYWSSVEHYIIDHTEADFTHGICPDCVRKLYPEIADRIGDSSGEAPA